MSQLAADPPSTDPRTGAGYQPHLGWLVAGLSAAAGVIHFAMIPAHSGDGLTDPIGFAVVGWFQLIVAGLILADRGGRRVYQVALAGNLVVLALYLWSRTAGLPVGSHSGVAEDFGTIDVTASLCALGVVLLSTHILLARERVAIGRLAPALGAVAVLGVATMVIASPDAASHGGDGHPHGDAAAAGGHGDHGTGPAAGDHDARMASIDAQRCDRQFNPEAYWEEAEYLGVDTYEGGKMAASEHAHDSTVAAEPDPTGGRGSEGLDELVQKTSLADGGEVASAVLVSELGKSSDEDYDAWLWWLRSSGTVGGGHGDHDAAAPDDAGGHGGHVGPQPWVAMTDQAECDKLAEELAIARDVALAHPTAADAEAAGWAKVTPYLPGIAAHYIKYDLIDGTFEVDEPEMILYDGNGPDARVVGLSYYIWHEGDAEPTQGFTGANDHFHRHIGLCQAPGQGVIGDSSTTAEECEAMGGKKAEGSKGWMSHAWVVPGCESAWGVFSAASPTLEDGLLEESGQNDGGCSASSVRDRYGLDAIDDAKPIRSTSGN